MRCAVEHLRTSSAELFQSVKTSVSPAVSREAREVRDTLKGLLSSESERAVMKLSFLWHEDVADLFPHLVAESFAHAGLSVPTLVGDMMVRAQGVANALHSPYVSVDLLCSRFAKGMAPVHVDYGEFLAEGRSDTSPKHPRALSFVMPYVGSGTEYLLHSRDLVERSLHGAIKRSNNSVVGIGKDLDECPEAAGLSWVSTPENSFTIHRNGLSIHRAPSSRDFRLLLAVDACIPAEKVARPLNAVRDKVIHNVRLIRGHRAQLG